MKTRRKTKEKTITANDARLRWSNVIDDCRYTGVPYLVRKYTTDVVAILPIAEYERLRALDEKCGVAA